MKKKKSIGLLVKYLFCWNLNFLDRFSKNTQFHVNPSSGESSCCMLADGRTDRQAWRSL